MKKIRNLLVALIFLLPIPQYATTTVNLTPVPKEMSYYKINRFHWHLTDDEN